MDCSMASYGILGNIGAFEEEKETFEDYADRFQSFLAANDIAEDNKSNILLATIGFSSYKILKNLTSPVAPNTKSFEDLIKLLKDHYRPNPEPVIIDDRQLFWTAVQGDRESVSDFVKRLEELSTTCRFGMFLEEALRDRLISGLNTTKPMIKARKTLLNGRNQNLTFKEAKEKCIEEEMAAAKKSIDDGESYMQYLRLQKKYRKADDTSNFDSTEEDIIEHDRGKAQRKSMRRKWSFRLPDEDTSEEDYFQEKPKKRKYLSPHKTIMVVPDSKPPPYSTSSLKRIGKNRLQSEICFTCGKVPHRNEEIDRILFSELREIKERESLLCTKVEELCGRERNILVKLQEVTNVVTSLKESINHLVGVAHDGTEERDLNFDLLDQFQFPMCDLKKFHQFDEQLNDTVLRKCLINKFYTIGGKNIDDCIWRIMGFIFDDRLAQLFNLTGRKQGKEERCAWRTLHLPKVVYAAVRQILGLKATDADMEDACRRYLKGGHDRACKGRIIRRMRKKQFDSIETLYVEENVDDNTEF